MNKTKFEEKILKILQLLILNHVNSATIAKLIQTQNAKERTVKTLYISSQILSNKIPNMPDS